MNHNPIAYNKQEEEEEDHHHDDGVDKEKEHIKKGKWIGSRVQSQDSQPRVHLNPKTPSHPLPPPSTPPLPRLDEFLTRQ
jgi:hypothetical protein